MALYNNLLFSIEREYCSRPHPGLIIAGLIFKEPYLRCNQCDLIVLAVLYLLIKCAYTTESTHGKFTIGYVLDVPSIGEISFTLSESITFRYKGEDLPVYALIDKLTREKADEYDDAKIKQLYIRIYLTETKTSELPKFHFTFDEMVNKLHEMINYKRDVDPIEVRTPVVHSNRKSRYPKSLTSLKPSSKELLPFIVADTETVLVNDVHVPYAVGFMEVKPCDALSSKMVETYYSTDYPDYIYKTIEERCDKMLFDFLERLAVVVRKNPSMKTVYFHNLSRFDGILLLKYFVNNSEKYTVKPLIRNNLIYEITVYRGKKLLYHLKDSLRMLPNSLDSLARHLCPQLGSKGIIQHNEIRVSNLLHNRDKILDYMKQDIVLLGGVMLKAQDIYWRAFKVDIDALLQSKELEYPCPKTFTFSLFRNPQGMIPYSFTVTSHFLITLGLSFSIFIGITIVGFQRNGLHFLSISLPAGVPLPLAPFLVLLELIPHCFRALSSGIRLFANMMAGHSSVKILSGFAWTMLCMNDLLFFIGDLGPLFIVLALTGPELGVAISQAHVSTISICIYLNDATNLHQSGYLFIIEQKGVRK
ncbi:putative ATP synthase, F0 complex, subunit A [Rosa chinensis]|uniref:DNA-directed DNA polymerase n=1 Tax=Rosa chinensis TaxID=74649 RepID=A0A2P6PM79_ROSCH|nr:putative ATP synthase, F0 complex, subunit A [Rosa chinensis]